VQGQGSQVPGSGYLNGRANSATPNVAGALAAKGAQEQNAGSPPVPQGAGRPRYRNPQTGQVIEWNGSDYVPVQ
jgi:hypothetical protein